MGRTPSPITPLTDDQRQMAEDNVNLVYGFVNKYKSNYPWLEYDDILGVCMESYCRAIQTHNPERGKISTHAYWYMRSYLNSYVNKNNNQVLYLEDLQQFDYTWDGMIEDSYDMPLNRLELQDAKSIMDSLKQYGLSTRDIDCLKWNYFYGDKYSVRYAVAQQMGITDSGVQFLLHGIRKKLKKHKEDIKVAISG